MEALGKDMLGVLTGRGCEVRHRRSKHLLLSLLVRRLHREVAVVARVGLAVAVRPHVRSFVRGCVGLGLGRAGLPDNFFVALSEFILPLLDLVDPAHVLVKGGLEGIDDFLDLFPA